MNQLSVYRRLFILVFITGTCLLHSCSDGGHEYDFPGDTMSRVYFASRTSTVNTEKPYTFYVKHTPVGSTGDPVNVTVPVRCTYPVSSDLRVTVAVNNSQVDEYNARNGTNYSTLPEGVLSFSGAGLIIPKGQYSSGDSLSLSISSDKYSQLTDSAYLVAVGITSVSGANDAASSSNRATLYMIIKTSQTNSYDNAVQGDMVGSVISNRSAWTASLNATPASGTLSTMFDGRTNTYWSLTPSQKASFTVDLNNTYSGITGIRIHTSSTTYALTSVTISTSTDGSNGTPQGTAALSTTAAYQYIKFYSPVSARYITLDIQGWRSSSSIRMAEFDVYVSN